MVTNLFPVDNRWQGILCVQILVYRTLTIWNLSKWSIVPGSARFLQVDQSRMILGMFWAPFGAIRFTEA